MVTSNIHRSALLISSIYMVTGALWIFFSDRILITLLGVSGPTDNLTMYQTVKGLFYVLVTAAMLYWLTRLSLSRQSRILAKFYEAENALKVSREQIEHLLEASPSILYALMPDTDGSVTPLWVSDSIEHLLGYQPADALEPSWWLDNIDPRDLQQGINESKQLLLRGHIDHEYRFRARNGKVHWIRDNARVIYDNEGIAREIIGSWTDVTETHEQAELQRQLAYYDRLTGLPNRLQLLTRLSDALQSHFSEQSMFGLLYIDLDDFKSVNDSLGHSTGDELLRAVGQRLNGYKRPGDTLARMGGDEFAFLLTKLRDANHVEVLSTQLLQALSTPFTLLSGRQIFVEACIGICLYPEHGTDEETLVRNADTAMYRAKQLGRNRYSIYQSEMSDAVRQQLDMETALRQAIARDELELFFQPKLNTQSGLYTGAEALLRWRRADGTLVSPADFIPLAERTGLIIPIGNMVIDKCCRTIRDCLDADLNPANIAINISINQFRGRAAALEQSISAALQAWQVPAQLLSVEITESALMDNPEETTAALLSIKSAGIRISLDDFGTGFSNMMHLSRMPLDYLKIDTNFTHALGIDLPGNQVVRSVVELAHRLHLKTIAEGVETNAQWQILKEMGCDELQGFLFCRPLEASAFLTWLRQHDCHETADNG
tara:strand:+ start:59352 stop:61334 length:1983 start_codon:yes stop_codon:yes gene_type:complete